MTHPIRFPGAILAACVLAACAATNGAEGPRAPALVPALVHYAGSPLAGASAEEPGEIAADPASSYVLRARLYALARGAAEPFSPLSLHTRLVAAFRGDEPIRPSADLGLHARLASGAPARAWLAALEAAPAAARTQVTELEGALPEGVSAALSLSSKELLDVPGEVPLRARVALEIARSASGVSAFVVREELAAVPDENGSQAGAPRVLRREYAALDLVPELDGAPLLLELLRPGGDAQQAPLVWVVELASVPADAQLHAQAHTRALEEIGQGARSTKVRRARLEREEAQGREIDDALAALRSLRDARPALCLLCSSTGAELAGDFALSAPDAELAGFVREVLDSAPDAQAAAHDGATLGFLLETRAWSFLSRGMDDKPLAPERLGLLVGHGGELARSAGAIEDVLASVKSLEGLRARILQENREALEDASPAVRVRATDWLAARTRVPPGYDPLGPLAERRGAIAAADEAAKGTK